MPGTGCVYMICGQFGEITCIPRLLTTTTFCVLAQHQNFNEMKKLKFPFTFFNFIYHVAFLDCMQRKGNDLNQGSAIKFGLGTVFFPSHYMARQNIKQKKF